MSRRAEANPAKKNKPCECLGCSNEVPVVIVDQKVINRRRPKLSFCFVCGANFKTETDCLIHRIQHKIECPYLCSGCQYGYTNIESLKMHVMNKHPHIELEYECQVCADKMYFKNRAEGISHLICCHPKDCQVPCTKSFICPVCSKRFPTLYKAMGHLSEIHFKNCLPTYYGCNICTKQFLDEDSLTKHMCELRVEANPKVFLCETCSWIGLAEEEYLCHLYLMHGKKCVACGKAFHTKLTYDDHKLECQTKNGIVSEQKSRVVQAVPIKDDGLKINHVNTCVSGKYVICICPLCSQKIEVDKFRSHLKTHTSGQKYKCSVCGLVFPNVNLAIPHFRKDHSGMQMKIIALKDEHETTEMKKSSVINNIHLQSMSSEMGTPSVVGTTEILSQNVYRKRPHECVNCKKRFCLKQTVVAHMKTHLNAELVHSCHICSRRFDAKSALKLHQSRIHGLTMRKFPCRFCSISFMTLAQLHLHNRRHLSKRSYICGICHVRLATRQSLLNHIAQHAKESGYRCTKCMCLFHSKKLYKMHMRMHEKQHQCVACECAFSDQSYLRRHIMTHMTLKHCRHCLKVFKTNMKLKQHYIHCHGYFMCMSCKKQFTNQLELQEHIMSNHRNYCQICQIVFAFESDLSEHMRSIHEAPKFTCQYCGCLRFTNINDLVKHEHKHTEEAKTPLTAKAAKMSTSTKNNSTQKVISVKDLGDGACIRKNTSGVARTGDLLERVMHKMQELQNRLPAEKKNQCSVCGMNFQHVYELVQHVSKHASVTEDRTPNDTVTNDEKIKSTPVVILERCDAYPIPSHNETNSYQVKTLTDTKVILSKEAKSTAVVLTQNQRSKETSNVDDEIVMAMDTSKKLITSVQKSMTNSILMASECKKAQSTLSLTTRPSAKKKISFEEVLNYDQEIILKSKSAKRYTSKKVKPHLKAKSCVVHPQTQNDVPCYVGDGVVKNKPNPMGDADATSQVVKENQLSLVGLCPAANGKVDVTRAHVDTMPEYQVVPCSQIGGGGDTKSEQIESSKKSEEDLASPAGDPLAVKLLKDSVLPSLSADTIELDEQLLETSYKEETKSSDCFEQMDVNEEEDELQEIHLVLDVTDDESDGNYDKSEGLGKLKDEIKREMSDEWEIGEDPNVRIGCDQEEEMMPASYNIIDQDRFVTADDTEIRAISRKILDDDNNDNLVKSTNLVDTLIFDVAAYENVDNYTS